VPYRSLRFIIQSDCEVCVSRDLLDHAGTASGGFGIDALASKSAKVKQACRFVKKAQQSQHVIES
jgi:hypothetical protein